MRRVVVVLSVALALGVPLASLLQALERDVDIYEAVGDAESVVIATVREIRGEQAVVLTVHEWLKGTPTPAGEITLKGETGHCVTGGPVPRFMKPGERFLVFVFPGGKAGRLGHIQKINPDATLPGGRPRYMDCGTNPPRTEAGLARLIKHIQSRKFVEQQLGLLRDPDAAVVREAVTRLGKARAGGGYDAILNLVQQKSIQRRLRQRAIIALGRIGDPRAVESLVEILAKESPGWGQWAAMALGEIGDRRAVPALLDAFDRAMMSGRYDPLSAGCVRALGRIGVYTDHVKTAFRRAAWAPGGYPAGPAIDIAREQNLRWMTPGLVGAMDSRTRSTATRAGYALSAMASMSGFPPKQDKPRLSKKEVVSLAAGALAARGISVRGRRPSVRDVNGVGWLVVYPPFRRRRRGGDYYVYVGDHENRAEILLLKR